MQNKFNPVFWPAFIIMLMLLVSLTQCSMAPENEKPNILFILVDDLGYGDLSCYGQELFQTPGIDKLASEGMLFTSFYAGSPVCGPSRSVLMTGMHTGHTRVRGNMCIVGGHVGYKGKRQVRRVSLTDKDLTVGQLMQKAGYHTGLVGKWHLGGYDPDAGPMDRGFDEFYGWLTLVGETNGYYPTKRFRNRELLDVPGNQDGNKESYTTDLCTDEAISFLNKSKDQPFFLYLAYNNPHSPLLSPDHGPFKTKEWTEDSKTYASMIYRLDLNISRLMKAIEDLGIAENTIVFFCSDNGPRSEPTKQLTDVVDFFDSNGPLRGYKRDLYEGGIRVPMLVRWPGKIAAGSETDLPYYFADMMPSMAELGGITIPPHTDGLSILPQLIKNENPVQDRYLYWEFFEGGFKQAVRWNEWKAVLLQRDTPMELYNLSEDISESQNVADNNPEVVEQMKSYLEGARTESANWPLSAF